MFADRRGGIWAVEQFGDVDPARLPMTLAGHRQAEQVAPPDRIAERPQPERGEQFAHFFRNEEQIIDDMLGRAGEARAE